MPETGDLVGPYRLIAQLGKGAMGEVWRARDERLDRYVALKIMPAELERDVERRTRMLREARAAAAIKHANVVTLFDIVKHGEDDVLVMELVEGRTLSDRLRKDGKPELPVALRWIEGIAEALVAAHARGILHRDIKAANIMVTNEDGIKVLDFGLAKLASDAVSVRPADASKPPLTVSQERVALDATMPSEPSEMYQTVAGQLIGTPLYMAPEQIDGSMPDVRSEVFSVGILAYELLSGKPPYNAATLNDLFVQIANTVPPPLVDVPASVAEIVVKAIAKNADARYQTMAELRDAIAAIRTKLFAPKAKKWLAIGGLGVAAIAATTIVLLSRGPKTIPEGPGDKQVKRAVEEFDLFYNDKALSSLRSALAIAPKHPRAHAYVALFGGQLDLATAKSIVVPPKTFDRALLDAAIALTERGPAAARDALVAADAPADRELEFWRAELSYKANDFATARTAFAAIADDPSTHLRGRIFDHYSSVLLYVDAPEEALKIGKAYRDAFPGEADAVGVYATTLAVAGKFPEAIAAAEEALRLNEGEDTHAGLAKVLALSGDRARAKAEYQASLDRAGPSRKPLRRAALALLQWIDRDPAAAQTVAPCFPGGTDSTARERGACLFVGAIVDPTRTAIAAAELDGLAASTNPYGYPKSLAGLVRAREKYLGGGCIGAPTGTPADAILAAYDAPLDFYAAYHVPFFSTWAACEKAAALASTGKSAEARALLEPIANRAPGRTWLLDAVTKYR